jgi:cullin-associated NEDD8-dissociated protein 1
MLVYCPFSLGPLVNRVKTSQVETIVDTLCMNMTCDKGQLRDISSVALKTVIMELPRGSNELIMMVCKKITGKLTNVIQVSEDIVVQLEALDIMAYVLSRFGAHLQLFHITIKDALLVLLENSRLAVRKRSITALSNLTVNCNSNLFDDITTTLLGHLTRADRDHALVPTYIQCIAAISRQSGQRFGLNLAAIIPVIVQYSSSSDDELKEYCVLAFESFVRKAPIETTQFLSLITGICLKYLCHDPNYNYDDGADDQVDMDTDHEEAVESDDEYSDDDDMSWKVRRASAKCLEAIISTRHDMLLEMYRTVAPQLIARYKEREENVKVDIFLAHIALLKQTKNVVNSEHAGFRKIGALNSIIKEAKGNGEENAISLLLNQVPVMIRSLYRLLKERSVKTRQGCFSLLGELISVAPGCLHDHIGSLMPGILFSILDASSSSNMKVDTLVFVGQLLRTHSPEVFYPSLDVLFPAVIAAVRESFYKITSEGLVVIHQLIRVIRPIVTEDFRFKQHVTPIYECISRNLIFPDLDQEVKEKAITSMGQFISTFADVLDAELRQTLPILVDKLKNEITRLTSIKALTTIALSQHRIDLAPYLPPAIPILSSFLRKNQRTLKISTLILLNSFVHHYTKNLTSADLDTLLIELPALINEADLHISQLTLELISSIISSTAQLQPCVIDQVLPVTFRLVRSPLLQGSALQALLQFFRCLHRTQHPQLTTAILLQALTKPIYNRDANEEAIHKQAYHSISKCVAAIAIDRSLEECQTTVTSLMNDIVNHKNVDSVQSFALLTIGEIGKAVDLSPIDSLKQLLVAALSSASEDVKSSASFALGSVSVGNLPFFLPFVLQEIESRSKRQYLLLHSLKEIITCQSIDTKMVASLQPHLESIWVLLLKHCQCPEEGTRNVVAECLGKLINLDPPTLLPKLEAYLDDESPLARSTVVTAIKFTISEQAQPIDALLRVCIGRFLKTLHDPDIHVRRVALVAFNSAAHNKPILIRDLLEEILPQLYEETCVRTELIREVEMGPFKHSVDDGLDIRKAAFECMYTLLDSCLDRIDIFQFLEHVQKGLCDHYDIKMLTYLMVIRLAHLCPSAVLNRTFFNSNSIELHPN